MKKILVILILVHVGLGLAVLANDKVALVLDVGGRGDLCQNDMAIEGATKTCKNLGLELVVIESNTSSSQLTNIRTAARSEEYELIIAVGSIMLDAINIVADEFPAQKFALIDGTSHASNVLNLPFDVADATALAGALAGLICAQFDYSEVGLILGLQIPVLFPYESGFRFGVWWARQRFAMDARHVPDVKVRMAEAGGFSDVALGSRLARDMLDQGVCVIYTVAGRVGLGVYAEIDAELREKGYDHGPPFFISGTGCNQDWFNDERGAVIGSVLLRWDEACTYAIKKYASGRFWGGTIRLGLADHCVSLSDVDDLVTILDIGERTGQIPKDHTHGYYSIILNWAQARAFIPAEFWAWIDELRYGILACSIRVPSATTLAEIEEIRKKYP